MGLNDYIDANEVEFTQNLIDQEDINNIEKKIDISFGNELSEYITKYGYLAYKHIELYGINSKQLMESDMVKQTQYIHKYFPKTISYIALENVGDGYYMLVSPNDEVYEFSSESDTVKDTGKKLFDYILARFEEVD